MDAFGDENVVGDEFPASAAADPAADFLAREQEELGDLGDELGLNQQEASVEAAEGIPTFNIDGLSAEDQAELEAVNAEFTEPRPDATPSPAFVMPPRPKEEPETIRKWREDQVKRLEEKDAIEADTMAKLRDEAQQELNEW
jgi:clathrin light chain B